MRAVWLDSGNDPNWEQLDRFDITWVYVPLNDPVADVRRRLDAIKARGLAAGVFAAWGWDGYEGDAHDFAWAVDERLRVICPDATATHPRVMLNDETHDPERINVLLRVWRKRRPRTATSWTLEGMQGGWFTPSLVKTIIDCKVRVVPQAYTGPMLDVDPLATVRDITKRGVPDSMVSPFYDAKTARTPFAEGFFFTAGRLPA